MERDHQSDYDAEVTALCERTLMTLIGDIGPWSERIYLVGGLAPRYIVGVLQGVSPHVGTTDVDLVIGLAVDGATVKVEFLCETDQTAPGTIFRPKQGTGSKIGAFNVPGAQLVTRDYTEHSLEAERLDSGGISKVWLRVSGVLAYTVLKIFAFQDRHDNKDSYDLVFTLANHPGGPAGAADVSRETEIVREPQVTGALQLLAGRFESPDQDGPVAYANFLASPDDEDAKAQLRNQAVAVVAQFLTALGFES